jgi:hypothetical protein
MTLEKISGGIDFVADTTPASSVAIDGDVYVDTSLSPPQAKVFDESVGSFVKPQTGIDWSQKTPQIDTVTGGNSITISGSGYIMGVLVDAAFGESDMQLTIDGNVQADVEIANSNDNVANAMPLHHRFESSFVLSESDPGGKSIISYVLD